MRQLTPLKKEWKWPGVFMKGGKGGKFGCVILAQEGQKTWTL